MKYIFIIFIAVSLLSSFKPKDKFSIEVEVLGYELKRKYSDWVYLLKDDKKIDSVNTCQYKYYFILQFRVRNNKFKFKGVSPGKYQIKYNPRFKFDSLATVQLVNSDKRVTIYFDKIPSSAYKQTTLIDKLALGDTLYINGYIAAGGEFGGYDEGLWIWNYENQLKGQFFRLANSYGMGWKENRVEFYNQNLNKAKAVSQEFILIERQLQDIKQFLVETRNYRGGKGFSNAPEFITVYNTDGNYQIIEHEFNWKPYLKLKEKITAVKIVYK